MDGRPYFKFKIEQIEALVLSSGNDLQVLEAVRYELTFRRKVKARAISADVERLIEKRLGSGTQRDFPTATSWPESAPLPVPASPPSPFPATSTALNASVPERIAVECAYCKTPNFVSTLDAVTQHLSCSSCKRPYEARFSYGVMRTIFQVVHPRDSKGTAVNWLVGVLICLVVFGFFIK